LRFFRRAVGKDGYGRFFIYRGGTGICVRPHRYALARSIAVPLGSDELGLHECDMPLCVKVCAPGAMRQHVVVGSQGDNMRRMAQMRLGGGSSDRTGNAHNALRGIAGTHTVSRSPDPLVSAWCL
jgi:hypothetical protein